MKYNFEKLLTIPKYQGGGITDTSNDGSFNRNNVNNSYLSLYRNIYTDPNFNPDDLNLFYNKYYNIMRGSGYNSTTGKAIKYKGVRDYLLDFNKRGFHTPEFMLGWKHSSTAYTGDNFDSGTWKNADDYVGAITALRYANAWNDAELSLANIDANKHGLEWVLDDRAKDLDPGDGRKFYKIQKMQNNPLSGDPMSNQTVEDPTNPAPEQETPEQQKNPEENQEKPKEEQEEPPVEPAKDYPIPEPIKRLTPWTDWIPLTAQLSNDLVSAHNLAKWQKLKIYPLEQAWHKQLKIGDLYNLRTQMLQNANELRGLGYLRSNSSDLRANLDNIRQYDTKASEIENQADLLGVEAKQRSVQAAQEVTNENKVEETQVANHNRMALAASWNNILDANLRKDLATTAALNSYIGNMYTSHGEWLKDARLNDLLYAHGVNEYLASTEAQKAYDLYNGLNEFNSLAYNDFKNWFNTDQARSMEGYNQEAWEAANANGTTEDYIKNLYRTSKDAESYRRAWVKEQEAAELRLIDNLQMIRMRRNVAGLYLPATVTNQGRYRRGQFAPTYQSIFSHKKGGSVRARAIDYWEHIRKENKDTKKSQEKRNSDISKKLSQDLDRLTKEQLIILRSIFK